MDNLEQLYSLLAQILRVGFVCGREPKSHRVRVECRDSVGAPFVSDWLQVPVARAGADREYDLPDIGEQVFCLFLPYGREAGIVLGSVYAAVRPAVTSGDEWRRDFGDGSWLEYDRAKHKFTGVIKGEADIKTDKGITVEAGEAVTVAKAKSVEVNSDTSVIVNCRTAEVNADESTVVNCPSTDLGGTGGAGLVTLECFCSLTGYPHPEGSDVVRALKIKGA